MNKIYIVLKSYFRLLATILIFGPDADVLLGSEWDFFV